MEGLLLCAWRQKGGGAALQTAAPVWGVDIQYSSNYAPSQGGKLLGL